MRLQMVVELTVDPAKGHAPRLAGEISHVDQGRVMFATLAPDRTPDAEAALRRAPDQRRRSNRQMSVEHAVSGPWNLAWDCSPMRYCGSAYVRMLALVRTCSVACVRTRREICWFCRNVVDKTDRLLPS